MAKRQNRANTVLDGNLAYVIGVFASDGNLSPDGRHLNITSKDFEMLTNCKKILGISNSIGNKARGASKEKKYYVLQFGDVNFYEFLKNLGLTPRKSLTLRPLKIPQEHYFDFFRGCIDGDGSIIVCKHPESKLLQLRLVLCSGSIMFLEWIHSMNAKLENIRGGRFQKSKTSSTYTLLYGKHDSLKLLRKMYHTENVVCLKRKKDILNKLPEWRNGHTR